MPKRIYWGLLGILLLVTGVVYGLLIWRTGETPQGLTDTLELAANARFVGSHAMTPDTDSLGRLVRGKLTTLHPETRELFIDAWVNFPDKTITRTLPLKLTDHTEYLCWKQKIQLSEETIIDVEDTMLMLSDTQKLYQEDETKLAFEDFETRLRNIGPLSAIVALEEPFSLNQESRAYQVAVLGCQ